MRIQTLQASIPRFASALLLSVILALGAMTAARAIEVGEVQSPGGLKAWLVEDYTVPIITVSVHFRGGSTQDPVGKEGMANLLSALFDEGAGPYDSKTFQARIEKLGIELGYSDGRDGFSGMLRTLRDDRADAFEMMRLSLTDLHFEPDAVGRMRSALQAGIIRRAGQARTKASEALRASVFGEHPYARPTRGTVESLASITPEDLRQHFGRIFARDNLTVSVVGAISAEETAKMLDAVFGALPAKADLIPVPQAQMRFGETIRITERTPQAIVAMAFPGVTRASPEFFAAYLANHILGGGTFSSRLYNEVREKRGLAYSVSSSMASYDHAAYISAGTGTRADSVAKTLEVMRGEIARMAESGPTQEELDAAKKYVIGSYAIRNLDTTSKVASALTSMQTENLGIDYIERRRDLISAVTLVQVREAARKLLGVEPTVVVVGPENS